MTGAAAAFDISRAEAITGWMRRQELQWLAAAAVTAYKVVEFGSHHGRSTRALADHSPGVVYAVDPWDDTYTKDDGTPSRILKTGAFEAFCQNLADHVTSGKVVPLRMTSGEAIKCQEVQGADLVFIDGDHRYQHCVDDIGRALRLVRDGGIVAGHDYGHPDWPGVRRAVDENFGNVNLVKSIWWVRV